MKRKSVLILITGFFIVFHFCGQCLAEKENVYNLTGEFDRIKTQLDTGFSLEETLDKSDLHYGWGLGEFYLKGYSKVELGGNGVPLFYKEEDAKLSLGFNLKQNIDQLNGNKDYKISEDINGYDLPFEIAETNFKRGCLILLRIDDETNQLMKPKYYTNYLQNVQNDNGSGTSAIELEETGIYRVALDYEITYPGFLGSAYYNNYKIYFEFTVKNTDPASSVLIVNENSGIKGLWNRIPKGIFAALAGVLAATLIAVIIMNRRSRNKLMGQIINLERELVNPLLPAGTENNQQEENSNPDTYKE